MAVARRAAERLGGRVTVHERFGTATVEAPDATFDLASARRERYEKPGALPEVELGASLAADLARRDFTVNAIAAAPRGRRAHRHSRARARTSTRGACACCTTARSATIPRGCSALARYGARLGFGPSRTPTPWRAAAIAGGALDTVTGSRLGAELRLLVARAAARGAGGARAARPRQGAARAGVLGRPGPRRPRDRADAARRRPRPGGARRRRARLDARRGARSTASRSPPPSARPSPRPRRPPRWRGALDRRGALAAAAERAARGGRRRRRARRRGGGAALARRASATAAWPSPATTSSPPGSRGRPSARPWTPPPRRCSTAARPAARSSSPRPSAPGPSIGTHGDRDAAPARCPVPVGGRADRRGAPGRPRAVHDPPRRRLRGPVRLAQPRPHDRRRPGAHVDENRARVAAATGCPRERFLFGRQVHGATVRRATEPLGPGAAGRPARTGRRPPWTAIPRSSSSPTACRCCSRPTAPSPRCTCGWRAAGRRDRRRGRRGAARARRAPARSRR